MSFTDHTTHHTKLVELLASIDEPLRRMDDGLKNIHDNLQGKQLYKLAKQRLNDSLFEAAKRVEILRWLSPEPYIQHHKQTKQGILTGTGQWLLSDPIFKKWKDDSASSILWLHGIPGSGKSKLV